MSVFTMSGPSLWKPFEYLRSILTAVRRQDENQVERDEGSRDRREFVLEMMQVYPGAFQSELDCQDLMRFYPSRF